MGTLCYTLGEAARLYGDDRAKTFWKRLDRLTCPRIQPGGVGGRIYFPSIAFEKWMAEQRGNVRKRK
ncbi:MAG: helix-turn-helix domain-containing protein [Fibrobacter sp.]|nr:helix-turn-helix domain-containing protein [Fibrobacter sp.]